MITNEVLNDVNVNYNNLLLSFADNPSSLLSFDVNDSQLTLIPATTTMTAKDDEGPSSDENNITAYFVNGVNLFDGNFLSDATCQSSIIQNAKQDNDNDDGSDSADAPSGPRIISIIIKPPNPNVNANPVRSFDPMLSKESVPPPPATIPSQRPTADFNDLALEPQTKQVTILVPEEEMHLLDSTTATYSSTTPQTTNAQPQAKVAAGTIDYPLPETEIQKNIRAFDLIFYNSHKIKLPNPMWGYHKNSIDKDIVIFSKARWFKSDVLIPPIYEKQVIFHESDDIKIYINNKFSPLEVRRPKDINELEVILRYVDETPICTGGPSITECDTVLCAAKDYAAGRWRHKLCPIVVGPQETICKFCSTINQVHRYPKKKRPKFGRRWIKVKDNEEDKEEES